MRSFRLFDHLVRRNAAHSMQKFVHAVKCKRDEMAMSISHAARVCRVSESYLVKLEGGRLKNIELKTIIKFCVGLGLEPKDVL